MSSGSASSQGKSELTGEMVAKRPTFGVSIRQALAMDPSGNFDAEGYAAVIAGVERLGYDQVVVADHVFVPRYWADLIGDVFFEPFTLLSYLAARTSRIGLTLGCLVVPYRQPFTTAKTVAAIDQLSGGRFGFGVVPGYLKEEFRTFGLPRDERNEMTNEFIRIMIELWSSESATYNGRYYSCDGVNVKPKCIQRPYVPIWVGGSSRNAMRRVAEFGDVWHPLGFQPVDDAYFAAHRHEFTDSMQTGGTTPARLREGLDFIEDCAGTSGRDISDLKVVVMVGRTVDVRAHAGSLTSVGDDNHAHRARVVDLLGRYLEAGATGFTIGSLGESASEILDDLAQFAEEVIPQL
jgi:probable F420-dependent oxidoreductase